MGRVPGTPLILGICSGFVLVACAIAGGESKGTWEPPPWPPGAYELMASVTYRLDSELGTSTERQEHRAELLIEEDQTLSLSSTSGLCGTRTPDEVQRDRARGQRTFNCQDALFVLKPTAGTVGGSVRIRVQEGIRTKGPCRQWEDTAGGQRICVDYSWHVRYRTLYKQASLRVMARGANPKKCVGYGEADVAGRGGRLLVARPLVGGADWSRPMDTPRAVDPYPV